MSGEKNWLIRTTKHQILGPISKDKLVEFLNKNALSQNDEVSSGNGYWFLIRERDLVEKYIFGDIVQDFNPISEAPNVLTAHLQTEKTGTLNKVPGLDQSSSAPVAKAHDSDEIKLPDESDLEFPDMGDDHGGDDNDITLVLPKAPVDKEAHLYADTPEIHTGGNDVTDITLIGDKSDHSAPAKKVKDAKTGEEVLVPSDDDLAYPDMGMASSNDHEEEVLVPDSADLEYPDMGEEVKLEASSGGYEIPSAELLVDIPEEEEEPIPEPVIELEKKRPAAAVATTPPPVQRAHSARPTAPSKKASAYEEEEDEDDEEEAPTRVKTKKSKKKAASAGPVHTPRNDRYLFFVLFLLLVLTMGIFYYYRKILNKPLPIIGIGDVEAQVINTQLGPIKKKHF
jgi:hypothetical protein